MAESVVLADVVNDLFTGKLKFDRAEQIIAPIQDLGTGARNTGLPVIFVGDAYVASDPEMDVWGEHAMWGTRGPPTMSLGSGP